MIIGIDYHPSFQTGRGTERPRPAAMLLPPGQDRISLSPYKNVRLELGVNNVTDKSPPIVTGVDCSTSSPAGANCNGNTFPGVYDAMGRYLFATITAQF